MRWMENYRQISKITARAIISVTNRENFLRQKDNRSY